jgi:hypothetical protein
MQTCAQSIDAPLLTERQKEKKWLTAWLKAHTIFPGVIGDIHRCAWVLCNEAYDLVTQSTSPDGRKFCSRKHAALHRQKIRRQKAKSIDYEAIRVIPVTQNDREESEKILGLHQRQQPVEIVDHVAVEHRTLRKLGSTQVMKIGSKKVRKPKDKLPSINKMSKTPVTTGDLRQLVPSIDHKTMYKVPVLQELPDVEAQKQLPHVQRLLTESKARRPGCGVAARKHGKASGIWRRRRQF